MLNRRLSRLSCPARAGADSVTQPALALKPKVGYGIKNFAAAESWCCSSAARWLGKRHLRMAKIALISGITGQDGSFLAELLLDKGYEVYGIIRRSSSFNTDRIDHLYQDPHEKGTRLHLVYGDLNDSSSLNTILRQIQPDEIY